MRISLLIFLLFIKVQTGASQLHVSFGTSITIEPGTQLKIDIPNQNFIIDSAAFVINNGLIILGDSTDINEFPMYPIIGAGIETSSRDLSTALAGTNIAGLGFILNNDSLPGVNTVTRGHKSLYSNGSLESIKRWYSISSAGLFPTGFSMIFHYDPTELNGNNSKTVKYISTIDTSSVWRSLGGLSDEVLFNTTASLDSAGFFTLVSTDIKLTSLNDTTFCIGDSLMVNFSGTGLFNTDNSYILQLSDSSGSFISPVIADTLLSDLIDFNEYISLLLIPSASYKLRVISTSPQLTSIDTGITIFGLPIISYSSLQPQYCSNELPTSIGIDPLGGFYDVSYLSGDSIFPANASIGINYFNYFFTDVNGCSNQYLDSTEIILAPSVPTISISYDSLFSSSNTGNQWYLNGSILPGDTNSFLIASANGNYQVEVTSINGCSSTSDTLIFTTLNNPVLNYSNTSFIIYPNPVMGNVLFLQLNNLPSLNNISITSILGQVIKYIQPEPNSTIQQVQVGNLNPGTYLINLNTINHTYSTPFLIVK